MLRQVPARQRDKRSVGPGCVSAQAYELRSHRFAQCALHQPVIVIEEKLYSDCTTEASSEWAGRVPPARRSLAVSDEP